jgi:hypothetical protein
MSRYEYQIKEQPVVPDVAVGKQIRMFYAYFLTASYLIQLNGIGILG